MAGVHGADLLILRISYFVFRISFFVFAISIQSGLGCTGIPGKRKATLARRKERKKERKAATAGEDGEEWKLSRMERESITPPGRDHSGHW